MKLSHILVFMNEAIKPPLFPEGIDHEKEWSEFNAAEEELQNLRERAFAIHQGSGSEAEKNKKIDEITERINELSGKASHHLGIYKQGLNEANVDRQVMRGMRETFGNN